MDAETKAKKLESWRQQADVWRGRLLRSYYGMRPGKRHEAFERCRGRLGDLEIKIQQLQGHVVEPKQL